MTGKAWGTLLAALVAALALGVFVASSVAAREVAPLDRRVTRLEAQREEDTKRLDEIKADVKAILKELRDGGR